VGGEADTKIIGMTSVAVTVAGSLILTVEMPVVVVVVVVVLVSVVSERTVAVTKSVVGTGDRVTSLVSTNVVVIGLGVCMMVDTTVDGVGVSSVIGPPSTGTTE
jgi:hypothetical protein